ncbi:hypothetical protein EYF80_010265 [Liparis tanakae]|uniref:Uncharacterized protein n=1 Tax=Liparis tanakae TaxID=230148 RepID=A0A4Z2INR3_9TELE|nr:hypothetical protein EYF80_010265 [Liparis tanakae]
MWTRLRKIKPSEETSERLLPFRRCTIIKEKEAISAGADASSLTPGVILWAEAASGPSPADRNHSSGCTAGNITSVTGSGRHFNGKRIPVPGCIYRAESSS